MQSSYIQNVKNHKYKMDICRMYTKLITTGYKECYKETGYIQDVRNDIFKAVIYRMEIIIHTKSGYVKEVRNNRYKVIQAPRNDSGFLPDVEMLFKK